MSDSPQNFTFGQRMREDLSQAFVLAEAELESPAADGLRAVVPAPPEQDFAEFEEESAKHRVLILRGGAMIAVTTLVSIGGTILLHSLFAGAFVVALLWGDRAAPKIGQGSGGDAASEGGGSGFMVIDAPLPAASPTPGAAPTAAAALAKPAASPAAAAASVAPQLPPELPEKTPVARAADPVPEPIAAPSAMPLPDDLGTVRVTPPPRPVESPAVPDSLTISPPPAVAPAPAKAPAPASVASVASAGRAGGAGARAADIGGGDYGDEPVFSLMKGDGSSDGSGTGLGHGSGLDRGLSAAYSQAQLLSPLNFPVPYQYQLKRPAKDIILNVTVLANGTLGDISVAQSCGIPDLDEAYKEYVAAHGRFRPAFDRGKAVTSVYQVGQMFEGSQ